MSELTSKCGFCHLGDEATVCGSLHCDDLGGKPIAAHHKCMQYSAGLRQYKSDLFGGFKLDKVKKEISRASRLACSICKKKGASGGCAWAPCKKGYHFPCAFNAPGPITKRYKVASGSVTVIMYRVFCSKQHENVYRQNIKSGKAGLTEEDSKPAKSGSSHKDLKDREADLQETKGGDSEESDTDSYDPKEPQKSEKPNVSIRSDDLNETVSSSHESPRLSQQEVIEETKKAFIKLNEKRKVEGSYSGRAKRLRPAENRNNNRSESPSLLSPVADKTRTKQQANGFDLSHSLSPEASDDNSEKSDSGMLEEEETNATLETEEVVFLIPSLLGVPDTEMEEVYKELEITPDQAIVWPPSNRTGSLQDKHLPHLMWSIVEAFIISDYQGLTTILRNPSSREYDYFVNFHKQQHDSIIQQVFHSIAEKLAMLNGKESGTGKRGQLISRKYQKMKVLVLYLSSKVCEHRKVISCLNSSLFQWNRDTVLKNIAGRPTRGQQEVSLLWKWLKSRLKSGFHMDSCPVEEVFINEKYFTEVASRLVDKLSAHPKCSSFSSNNTVSILTIDGANRDIVKYDSMVQRAIEQQSEISICTELYFIIGLDKGDNIHTVKDILPWKVVDVAEVYTAFDPEEASISCLLVYIRKGEESEISTSRPAVNRNLQRGRTTPVSSTSPVVVVSPLKSSDYKIRRARREQSRISVRDGCIEKKKSYT